jgi:hypothetical protein
MRSPRSIFVAAILLASFGRPASFWAAEGTEANRAAAAAARKQVRSQTPSQRVAAFERLRDFPALEAVKVTVSALADAVVEVRRAAYETLLAWKDRPEVCTLLLKTLEKDSHSRKGGTLVVPSLIAVLLASDLPETQRELSKFLESYLSASKDAVGVVAAVADELGEQGDEQALTSLQRLMRLKCLSSSFACRRAVVRAMCRIELPKAIEDLIALLPGVDGEVRGDILQRLASVSGRQYDTHDAWRAWWKEHQEGFEFPARAERGTAAPALPAGGSSYYGLPIYARRMVFVLDTSGSMEGPRLSGAKRELMRAISGLPGDTAFGIVVFNDRVVTWQKGLMPATLGAKQAAGRFVAGLRAGGKTVTYDALEAALRFDAEAIYLLSDGEPHGGKIAVPAAIVAALTQANRGRRMSFYTIGMMPGPAGGPLDVFLKTLAEQNFGAYRRVEQ